MESTVTDSEKNRTFDPTIIPKTNGLDPRFQSGQHARTTEPVPERLVEEAERQVALLRRPFENRLDGRRERESARSRLDSRMKGLQRPKSQFTPL